MKIDIVLKNYEAPQRLVELINKKTEKLSKHLGDACKIKVLCRAEKETKTLEITASTAREVYRAEVCSLDMFENLDEALKKIERQIIKQQTRRDFKSRKGQKKELALLYNESIKEREPAKLVRTKRYELPPISVDEAIEALEALDHEFYVFLNRDTKQINVLYKRKDGDLGIIEAMI